MEISLPLSFRVVERKREKRSREERKIGWLVEKAWVIGRTGSKRNQTAKVAIFFYFIILPTHPDFSTEKYKSNNSIRDII